MGKGKNVDTAAAGYLYEGMLSQLGGFSCRCEETVLSFACGYIYVVFEFETQPSLGFNISLTDSH